MVRYSSEAKHVMFQTAYRMGLYRALKSANDLRRRRVTIVTYHRVAGEGRAPGDRSLANRFVRAETFEKQLLFFKKNYRIVGFDELDGWTGRDDVPSGLMLITFDDGYRDFRRCAYPILRKHGIRATLFVPAGLVGTSRRFPFWWDELYCYLHRMASRELQGIACSAPEEIRTLVEGFKADMKGTFDRFLETQSDREIERVLESMRSLLGDEIGGDGEENALVTWNEVREVSDLVGIGSHTLTHRNLRYLAPGEIEDEVARSKREIEDRLGRRVLAFSYPNGYYDARVVEAVRRANYRFAVTTDNGLNDSSGSFLLKRINLWERSSSVVPGRFSEGKLALRVAGL